MQGARRVMMVLIGCSLGLTAMAGKKNVVTTNSEIAGTGNLSKIHREELVAKIGKIKEFLQQSPDTNAVQLLSFAADLEKEVRNKKFGLVFEEHKERVDVELEENLPVLTENKSRLIDNGGEVNFLIEGDNLAALKLLEKTHRGKIDLIYIDPPYNTGSKDFVYNDRIVDITDLFRHSKWLSFMRKRLDLAKHIMSDKGVIFISIDDNEQAELKVLCDDIFGHNNFITCFPWQSRQSLQNDTDMSINHEYIICYAKNRRQTERRLKAKNAKIWRDLPGFVFQPMSVDRSKYSNPDDDPRGPWKADPFDAPNVRENLSYAIVNPNTGEEFYPPNGRHWRMMREKYEEALLDNRIIFGKSGKSKPQLKVFFNEQEAYGSVPNSWFSADTYGTATEGTKELQSILGKGMFDTVKPTRLIEGLITLASNGDITVLDFFAGSGTTGHAVMKLNAEDGGKRKFILVTNNENEICEKVTYERLKRVIEKENYAAKLKYYKIDYVPIKEQMYYEYADDLLAHIRELVELENGVDFTHDSEIAIVLTDDEIEKLSKNASKIKKIKTLYRGHNVMMSKTIEEKLKGLNIEIKVIPQYYYPELEG